MTDDVVGQLAPSSPSGHERENCSRNITYQILVTLFVQTDADDLLTEEEERKRRAPGQAQQISPGH
jgi:hypothetical protein